MGVSWASADIAAGKLNVNARNVEKKFQPVSAGKLKMVAAVYSLQLDAGANEVKERFQRGSQ